MVNFCVGDKIVCIKGRFNGLTGVVCDVSSYDGYVGVRLDECTCTHDCNGHCEAEHGYYFEPAFIKITRFTQSDIFKEVDKIKYNIHDL